jgi:hypothetical protein
LHPFDVYTEFVYDHICQLIYYTRRPGVWTDASQTHSVPIVFTSLLCILSHAASHLLCFSFSVCLTSAPKAKVCTVSRSLVFLCPPIPLKYDYFHIHAHQAISRTDDQIRLRNDPFHRKKYKLSEYTNFIILPRTEKKILAKMCFHKSKFQILLL